MQPIFTTMDELAAILGHRLGTKVHHCEDDAGFNYGFAIERDGKRRGVLAGAKASDMVKWPLRKQANLIDRLTGKLTCPD